jgi:hypothetical protein
VHQAFIDESQVGGTGSGQPYILTASFPHAADPDSIRDRLRAELPRGAKKLHWREASPAKRASLVDVVSKLELVHFVIVREYTEHERPERSRRACIEQLLYELQTFEIENAVFESRGKADDELDVKMVQHLRSQRTLPRSFTIDHVPGPADPLLWVADIVCGAIGESQINGGVHGLEHQAWIMPTNQLYPR